MSEFLTKLSGDWLDDDVRYMLTQPLIYKSDLLALGMGAIITVPAGFVTDFASVPRVPIIYELFGDRAHHESVVHDFLYQTHGIRSSDGKLFLAVSRGMADKVFREAMEVRGKPTWIRDGMYWGVRLGGWNAYRTGPKRFLKLNPNGGNT